MHVVSPGESLWTIASARLATEDPVLIDSLWRQIYERNRVVIGPDPSLIFPGQRLVLPPDCP